MCEPFHMQLLFLNCFVAASFSQNNTQRWFFFSRKQSTKIFMHATKNKIDEFGFFSAFIVTNYAFADHCFDYSYAYSVKVWIHVTSIFMNIFKNKRILVWLTRMFIIKMISFFHTCKLTAFKWILRKIVTSNLGSIWIKLSPIIFLPSFWDLNRSKKIVDFRCTIFTSGPSFTN